MLLYVGLLVGKVLKIVRLEKSKPSCQVVSCANVWHDTPSTVILSSDSK